jgi:two-component system, LytTR family, response regulator
MIRAVIADDEVLARQKLRILLQSETDLEVVGEGASGEETLELVRTIRPELLFLDVKMPGMDGFDMLDMFSNESPAASPKVVFTTAYDSYAIRAFEINAIDYLLKPFTAERLRAAVERARQQLLNAGVEPAGSSREPLNGSGFIARLVFKSRGRILFLPVSDIRWIGAEENYVRLITNGESHLLRETMMNLEGKLDPQTFLRVHRSFIVNLQRVKEVRTDKQGDMAVILDDGEKVPMSRTYRARLQQLLQG